MIAPSGLRAVLFNTTARNGHHGCALVGAQIDRLAGEAGIAIIAHLGLEIPRSFPGRADYDLVLVNGEGTIHHDQPGARRVAEIAGFAARSGKPAYLINAQYEANSPTIAEGMRAFRRRYVRDSVSRAEMAKAELSATIVPDLSLTWQAAPGGAAGNGLVFIDSVRNSVSAGLYELAATQGGRYLTIKTEPPMLPDFPDRNGMRRAKYFARRAVGALLPSGWRLEKFRPSCLSFESFVAALPEKTGLIVSGRFHGVCMALVLEVPFIGLRSNTSKVEALMADIGLDGRTAASVDDLSALLAERSRDRFRFTAEEIGRIRSFRRRAVEAARAMFAEITADARTGSATPAGTADLKS